MEKIKVGIITIHNSPNYGACLQTYALFKYLELQGFDCQVIDLYRPGMNGYKYSYKYQPLRQKQSYIKLKLKTIRDIIIKKRTNLRNDKFETFNNYIKYSSPYKSIDELYKSPPQYDIYISGSDQIWNPLHGFNIEPYFLTFAPQNSIKISYASSIGLNDLLYEEKTMFSYWLSDYKAISVREKQAQLLLNDFMGNDIVEVLDPTFLLNREQWIEISRPPQFRNKYIAIFSLQYSKELIEYGIKLSKESKIPLYVLGQGKPTKRIKAAIYIENAGPLDFLGFLKSADIVLTDSFHGTALSIILGTNNFYSYIEFGNKRGVRITNILSTFDVSNHLLDSSLAQSYKELIDNKIDHIKLFETIKSKQLISQKFLLNNLNL